MSGVLFLGIRASVAEPAYTDLPYRLGDVAVYPHRANLHYPIPVSKRVVQSGLHDSFGPRCVVVIYARAVE
jgi:hypothetical protein